jgi:hypothetical protein
MTKIPGINKDIGLQMAFKVINNTAGPNRLVPILLVFRAYPHIVQSDVPSPTTIQHAAAIKKAMARIQKLRAEQQIANALNMQNRPSTSAIHNLLPNSPVLVYREDNTGQSSHWDRPFDLLTVKGETCTIKLPSRPTTFRSTVIKPYLTDNKPEPDKQIQPDKPQQPTTMPPEVTEPPKRGQGRLCKYPLLTAITDVTTIYLS